MDEVCIHGLEIGAFVGVYDHEYGRPQRLRVDVTLHCDLTSAASSDRLQDSLDYDRVASVCRDVGRRQHHQLIETIASKIAHEVREVFIDRVRRIEVRVSKPGAVPDCETVSVKVDRRFELSDSD